jgi:hypothetical protein
VPPELNSERFSVHRKHLDRLKTGVASSLNSRADEQPSVAGAAMVRMDEQ